MITDAAVGGSPGEGPRGRLVRPGGVGPSTLAAGPGRADTDVMVADTLGRASTSVDVELLLRAARAAMEPRGGARWIARPVPDGLQFRSVVKDWVDGPAEPAREMRVACGAAVCTARLALLVQGREPTVAHPSRPGLLAALSAGARIAPRDQERRLYRAVFRGAPVGTAPVTPDRLQAALRRVSDIRHAWLRTVAVPAPALLPELGHRWQGRTTPTADGVVAVVGAPATDRIADLRVGDAVQHLGLVCRTLGWELQVLAGPVRRDRVRLLGPGMPDGSLVLFRAEPGPADAPLPGGDASDGGGR